MESKAMQSAEIGELAAALAAAQGEMEGARRDANNPFFKSDYPTLYSVWQACREPLSKNSLAVIQTTASTVDTITVYTMLAHSSGQWVKGELTIHLSKVDPQIIGSCITYFRRYGLAAIAGLSPLDDDAEVAMASIRHQNRPVNAPEGHQDAKSPTEAYLDKMRKAKAFLKQITGSDDVYYSALNYFHVSHADELTDPAQQEVILNQLRTFAAKNKQPEQVQTDGEAKPQ